MITSLLAVLLLSDPTAVQTAPKMDGQFETVRRYATDARQGVAVSATDVYSVSNWTLTRYDKATGEARATWSGDPALFPHINSCSLIEAELVCAASNFPHTPHVSTIEIFEPQSLEHRRTVSLGLGTGSLTFIERHDGAWYGMYANYDGRGGEAPRTHKHTQLVRFDDDWRKTQSWAMPASVLARIAPMSISGGGWGPDGQLYLSGHDHPEAYVVAFPKGGGTLIHTATYAMEAEGQAIDWDESQPGHLYGILRRTREVVVMKKPD